MHEALKLIVMHLEVRLEVLRLVGDAPEISLETSIQMAIPGIYTFASAPSASARSGPHFASSCLRLIDFGIPISRTFSRTLQCRDLLTHDDPPWCSLLNGALGEGVRRFLLVKPSNATVDNRSRDEPKANAEFRREENLSCDANTRCFAPSACN
jgi:hypothetical protein